MVFAFRNHLQLVCILIPPNFFFHELEWQTSWPLDIGIVCYFLDSLGFVAKILFVRESHGFHISKPFTTLRMFLPLLYIFFMGGNGKYRGALK